MNRVGLVLEGGGMRGAYTAGVLELFLDAGIAFPYVVAVSAGACQAASYLSRQKGRNKTVTIDYVNHPRYLSVWNLFRERSLFGMNLLFDELPHRLVPFDFDAFYENPAQFWAVTTDAVTGAPYYKEKTSTMPDRNMMDYIRASSSLPFVSPPVRADDRMLFDGGVADPIPLAKSMQDGNIKHVAVLTREAGYRKMQERTSQTRAWLARRLYPRYPGLIDALMRRAEVYDASLDLAEESEERGDTLIIRPSRDLGVGRMTKDQRKLTALYELGYEDARAQLSAVEKLL